MLMNRSIKVLVIAVLGLAALSFSSLVMGQTNFLVTIEQPGVQESNLFTNPDQFGATEVFVESFNSQLVGFDSAGFSFAGDDQIGNYSQSNIVSADVFGGARGADGYFTVHPGRNGSPGDAVVSIFHLDIPQRYFGFWWSAGDASNELEFYQDGVLIQRFTTADVIDFLGNESNTDDYFGNPNAGFLGGNQAEPYGFLNFFANPQLETVVFDEIHFINESASSGFESDNHTIAASFEGISGEEIISPVPEPTTWTVILLMAFLRCCCLRFRTA